ncbi:hypothetical protein [Ornithinimicrobium sp. W1665]|uniref:hypothetical protein n=1 Tax=Ornithinimicrobium sp. W1665 TaxID=3416666 RepID=UPI003D6B6732
MTDTPAADPSVPAADPAREARIRELSKAHVFTSWSAQKAVDPLPLAGGEGGRGSGTSGVAGSST